MFHSRENLTQIIGWGAWLVPNLMTTTVSMRIDMQYSAPVKDPAILQIKQVSNPNWHQY